MSCDIIKYKQYVIRIKKDKVIKKILEYKKNIRIIAMLAIASGLVYVGYAYFGAHNRGVSTSTDNLAVPSTLDPSTNNGTDKTSGVNADTNNNVDISKNTSEIPISKETTISIDQLYQNGSDVIYGGVVTNPGTNGTCSASFNKQYSRPVVPPVNKINGSVCGPFTIYGTSFDSLGDWTLTLRYYSDNSQAVATKTIEVK